jgi:signal transduction histidine kinase/ligand-binding sensor domain-containing protein/DNA-binding response OmpR family regulator
MYGPKARIKAVLSALFFTLLIGNTPLFGQAEGYERIDIEDGLSQGMIYDMLESQQGYLWIGTKDGLNRYNGYEFKVYNHLPFDTFSISGHVVTALEEDHAGRLWIGTLSNGLNVFDPETEQFWHIFQREGGLSSNNIRDLALDKDGNLWIGTATALDRLSIPESFNTQDYSMQADLSALFEIRSYQLSDEATSVWSVLPIEDKVYLGGEHRFFEFDVESSSFRERLTDEIQAGGEAFYPIQHIVKYRKSGVLISLSDQIVLIEGDSMTSIPYNKGMEFVSQEIYVDRNNNIWTGLNTLSQFMPDWDNRAGVFEFPLGKASRGGITKITEDRNGILWLGTKGYGLIKYNPNARIFNHLYSGSNSSVRQIYIDQQRNYWVWNYRYEMKCVDPQSGATYLPDNWPPFLVEARWILQSKDGVYWLHFPFKESTTELISYDPASGAIRHYPYEERTNPLSPVAEGGDGRIWLSCLQGRIMALDRKTGKYQYFELEKELGAAFAETEVLAIHPEINGQLWLGTFYGLIKYTPSQNEWKVFRHHSGDAESLSENYVLSIHEDKKNKDVLWIGTKGGGLNRFEKSSETFTAYDTDDGLPNNVVYGILEDREGYLWLSTNRGLARFDPKAQRSVNYSSFDGLQSNEFNTFAYAQAEDGTLAFGGINGLNIFHPDSLQRVYSTHKVVFSEVKINNEEALPRRYLPRKGKLVLPHHQNLFYFKFAVTDYTAPQRNTYRYQMVGIDDDPIYVGSQREVAYANLAPGSYTFKVWGANNNGIWSDAAEIPFTIRPPWWATPLAYVAYLLLAGSALLVIFRFQLNRLKLQKQLEFEHREAERLAEIDLMKTNFFSNVTHEFRTPLTLILEPARQLYKRLKANTEDQQLMEMIITNGQYLLQLVNRLLDLSKIEGGYMKLRMQNGDLVNAIEEAYKLFVPIAQKKEINLHFQSEYTAFYASFDKEKIDQCISNLLSNAIKFTGGGGSVSLSFSVSEAEAPTMALIRVSDTGPGIPQDKLSSIFDRFVQLDPTQESLQRGTGIGLSLVKELLRLMEGDIEVESQPGKGTTFVMRIPVFRAEEGNAEAGNGAGQIVLPAVSEMPPGAQEISDSEQPLVLVVEDNDDLRHFISRALSTEFRVVTAINGEEGWQKTQNLIPDLVVTDLMMPKMDGLQLLQKIKSTEPTAHIPVIMLTAKASVESKISGLKAGAEAYLSKPFHTEELLVRTQKLIEQRRRLQQLFGQQKGVAAKQTDFFSELDNEFLKKLTSVIDQNIDSEHLSAEKLAQKMFLSRSQLHRKLKALTNQSATEFVRNYRLDRSMELLQTDYESVGQVASRVGFHNQQYFSTRFKERFGRPPSEV